MSKDKTLAASTDDRGAMLERERNRKLTSSPHTFVRGNTVRFYEWLSDSTAPRIPDGPPVWICGDCHLGNLGPVVSAEGDVRIHIRDLDHTVVANPSFDIIRLALSLASWARGSNLPGVTTARMLESIVDGYESAFRHDFDEMADNPEPPDAVRAALRASHRRTWKSLANERLKNTKPYIPLGAKFWPVSVDEREAIESVFAEPSITEIATMIESREEGATVETIDAAYWKKGCSSLGLLRYGVLLGVSDHDASSADLSLMDVKQAVASAAPAANGVNVPADHALRVVEGARRISPFLGERMRAARLLDTPVFIRELLPQDLTLALETTTTDEALKVSAYLATVVGFAHARQMYSSSRVTWLHELSQHRSKDLMAPSWLWNSVVGLLVDHERAYLEHCRRYARDIVSP